MMALFLSIFRKYKRRLYYWCGGVAAMVSQQKRTHTIEYGAHKTLQGACSKDHLDLSKVLSIRGPVANFPSCSADLVSGPQNATKNVL